jgi:hypothetical protein
MFAIRRGADFNSASVLDIHGIELQGYAIDRWVLGESDQDYRFKSRR